MTLIITETGEAVEFEFLIDMLNLAMNREDFLQKVNMGITDELSTVSPENDIAIIEFYDNRK